MKITYRMILLTLFFGTTIQQTLCSDDPITIQQIPTSELPDIVSSLTTATERPEQNVRATIFFSSPIHFKKSFKSIQADTKGKIAIPLAEIMKIISNLDTATIQVAKLEQQLANVIQERNNLALAMQEQTVTSIEHSFSENTDDDTDETLDDVLEKASFAHFLANKFDKSVAWISNNKGKTLLGAFAITALYGASWYTQKGAAKLPFMESVFAPAFTGFTTKVVHPAVAKASTLFGKKIATTTVDTALKTVLK